MTNPKLANSKLYVGHQPMVRSGLIAGLVFAIDQASKSHVLTYFDALNRCPHGSAASVLCDEPVAPLLNFTMVWNPGVSMSLFQASDDIGRWLLVLATSIIALVILWWLTRERDGWQRLAFALILGGAIGNIVDRIRYGAVADFIRFTPELPLIGQFWVFNIADAAISLGVALLILRSFADTRKKPPTDLPKEGQNP
jgi:signal peptidase II